MAYTTYEACQARRAKAEAGTLPLLVVDLPCVICDCPPDLVECSWCGAKALITSCKHQAVKEWQQVIHYREAVAATLCDDCEGD